MSAWLAAIAFLMVEVAPKVYDPGEKDEQHGNGHSPYGLSCSLPQ
jgi:hypothetical protein